MTPKEKAKELIGKYLQIDFKGLETQIHILNAKQCALIVVDEILNELFEIALVTASSYVHKHIDYYQEVKQEIEKL